MDLMEAKEGSQEKLHTQSFQHTVDHNYIVAAMDEVIEISSDDGTDFQPPD